MQLLECIPNFSEGRNAETLAAIAEAITSVDGVRLLHQDVGAAAHRTVFTFVGAPLAVVEAAFRAIQCAAQRIDMRQHQGEHPRIGATDVCPLVPLGDTTLAEAAQYAHLLAQRVGELLQIPVFMYEAAATRPARRLLAQIRKGEYEGLGQKMAQTDGIPDYGSTNPDIYLRTGATIIGARPFLIAYNINLTTKDPNIAQRIAEQLRERGYKITQADGTKKNVAGRLPSVRAIGWYIEEYGRAQVSLNFTDFRITPPHIAVEACRHLATSFGTSVTGSELIGLIPLAAMLAAGTFYLGDASASEAAKIKAAVIGLGLSDLAHFEPSERILEYRINI
jgi:glutamate formiminotransferase / formiminotetrahydrofolate cyclodeaminase